MSEKSVICVLDVDDGDDDEYFIGHAVHDGHQYWNGIFGVLMKTHRAFVMLALLTAYLTLYVHARIINIKSVNCPVNILCGMKSAGATPDEPWQAPAGGWSQGLQEIDDWG